MSKRALDAYGSWRSPVTADDIVAETVGLAEAKLQGDALYWVELRPREQGRCVIVRREASGRVSDLTPPPFSARTRVHEYGGGAFTVYGETVYFANLADQRLYRQASGELPKPMTPEGAMRFADLVVAPGGRELVAVREDHTSAGTSR